MVNRIDNHADDRTRDSLQHWISKIVPLKALGIELIWSGPDDWHLSAPLELNHNHMGTGFGGSIATLATLAGWVQTWLLLDNADDYNIVIANSNVTFHLPVTAAFTARAEVPAAQDIAAFQRCARVRSQAKISVRSEVLCERQCVATFSGRFVARRKDN